ncbi:hypothetical protein L1887_09802 [Cichorium endivia]|nr:hypothetical protein L1887_09802 [Cichorium endivia]
MTMISTTIPIAGNNFNFLNDQGTHIIIYNIWEDEEGQLELDFDTDPHSEINNELNLRILVLVIKLSIKATKEADAKMCVYTNIASLSLSFFVFRFPCQASIHSSMVVS